jgi:MscS family membrane protein
MQEMLVQSYYGNTMMEWGIALGIALGAFIVGKIFYWITSGVLKRLTARTETKVDDVIIDMIDEPLVLVIAAFGLRIAVGTLNLPGGVSQFFGNALQGLTVVAIAWMIVRLFDAAITHLLQPAVASSESDLDDQLLPILRKGGKTILWSLGIIMALNNAGYDVAALIAGLGIGGLALAMAAQDTVKNVFGGFTIFTDRPLALNDRVVVGGFDAVVEEIGLRTTRMRTLAGRVVTMPNSTISNSAVENISSEPSRKVIMTLGLTYDTSPDAMRRALEILREIETAHTEDTDADPVIAFSGFGDFSMNILFIYYIRKGADIMGVQTSINLAILDRFNEAGLSFAFPTQTIELAGGMPKA